MTKIVKVAGWEARPYVQARTPFTNHNKQLFGRYETPLLYVVYSYGEHWPLFAWDGFDWYENEEKYSLTTSKHRSQTHPLTPTIKLSRARILDLIQLRRGMHRQMDDVQTRLGLAA